MLVFYAFVLVHCIAFCSSATEALINNNNNNKVKHMMAEKDHLFVADYNKYVMRYAILGFEVAILGCDVAILRCKRDAMLGCDVTSRLHRRIATLHRRIATSHRIIATSHCRIATSHPRIAHRVTYNQRRNGGPSRPSYKHDRR